MTDPAQQWWVINGKDLLDALRACHDGTGPAVQYLELVANSTVEDQTRPQRATHDPA